MNIRNAVFAVGAGSFALSCSEGSTAPPVPPPPAAPTAAVISLLTPNSDDGAIVITLRGPELSDIQATSSAHLLYARVASGQAARVIVVGDLSAGPIVKMNLGAGHRLSEYSTAVEQVAMRNDSLRATTTGYQLSIAAAP